MKAIFQSFIFENQRISSSYISKLETTPLNIEGTQNLFEMSVKQFPKVYLYRRIVQAKLFIDSHYSRALDINNIADEAFFSKFHFIRLFKQVYGKTPYQYLSFVRIEKAMQLFQCGKTVSETCEAVGFESLSSFSGLFKRTVGLPPSAFIEKQERIRQLKLNAPLRLIPGCFAQQAGWLKNSNSEEVS